MVHFVAAQLRVRLTALEKALDDAQDAPGGEEVLHDLRVASRRFVQALRLFARFLEAERVKKMRHQLSRLIRRCGAVRDCDVAMQVLAAAKSHDAALREVLAVLRAQRQIALVEHLRRWRGARSASEWKEFLVPQRVSRQTSARFACRALPRMLDELFVRGKKAVSKGTEQDLHRLRLIAKRFRYSLELFEDVYGSETRKCLRVFAALQDRLGAMQDCVATLSLVSGHPEAEAAVRGLLETRRRDFDKHWKTFHKHHARWKRWLKGETAHSGLPAPARRSRIA